MSNAAYLDLDRCLGTVRSGVDASEAHGWLCGALCAQPVFPATEWAAEVLPDDADAAAATPLLELLSELRQATLASLAGDDMDFQPLLPADTDPLDQRVRALASWCGGFLYGLGRSGMLDRLPDDLGEILNDFSEISRAALAAGEGGDEAEGNYAELVEFVRASVQLTFLELAPRRAQAAAPGERNH